MVPSVTFSKQFQFALEIWFLKAKLQTTILKVNSLKYLSHYVVSKCLLRTIKAKTHTTETFSTSNLFT